MLTGSGLVPADFFTAGSSLSKAVIGCESSLPSCCASGGCFAVAEGCCHWCSMVVCSVLHTLALPVGYAEGLFIKRLTRRICCVTWLHLLALYGLLTSLHLPFCSCICRSCLLLLALASEA